MDQKTFDSIRQIMPDKGISGSLFAFFFFSFPFFGAGGGLYIIYKQIIYSLNRMSSSCVVSRYLKCILFLYNATK